MLQKEFFQVQPFNPNPYWDPVIVNLSGAQKFEEDTVFMPGRYKIEVAPGSPYYSSQGLFFLTAIVNMVYEENITQPFIVRAYCGSNGTANSVGQNPYSGPFKVNGMTAGTLANGIDVNHIFGAGGGNYHDTVAYLSEQYCGGGPNCLGNGSTDTGGGVHTEAKYGAGSCLHLLPVGGVFGTDYIRAYHAAPLAGVCGGAYGGGQGGLYSTVGGTWAFRGGNSPYGNGGSVSTDTNARAGKGIGGGGKPQTISPDGITITVGVPGGAYFNGIIWIDAPGYIQTNPFSSRIRITYLGPLD